PQLQVRRRPPARQRRPPPDADPHRDPRRPRRRQARIEEDRRGGRRAELPLPRPPGGRGGGRVEGGGEVAPLEPVGCAVRTVSGRRCAQRTLRRPGLLAILLLLLLATAPLPAQKPSREAELAALRMEIAR